MTDFTIRCLYTILALHGMTGCSGEMQAPERVIGTREWTLSQGSVVTSLVRLHAVDAASHSAYATIVISHRRQSSGEVPVQNVEVMFTDSDSPVGWMELQAVAPPNGVLDQKFEMTFSAPLPWTIDIRATVDGQTEELTGWVVDLEP